MDMDQIENVVTLKTSKFFGSCENPMILRGFIFPVELLARVY